VTAAAAEPWTARRILTELCDRDRREAVLVAFWRHAEPGSRAVATLELARALSFREVKLRQAPVEKKAAWLLSRLPSPRFTEVFETALMVYHTSAARELMAACLDRWGIAHQDGILEGDEHAPPDESAVEAALGELRERFLLADLLLYLATVGLLMEPVRAGWAAAAWPVVDRHRGEPSPG
jgi:hypothetical protein